MLSNVQVKELCRKMSIPLHGIYFKSQLKNLGKIEYGKAYIINLESEVGEDGEPNIGSHFTCFQANKLPNGKIHSLYFDSYGTKYPDEVEDFIGIPIGYTSVDLQALVAETCGYWCCAYLYFINTFPQRTGDMYVDADTFCNLFNDLNHSCDWQTNETILKQFFRSPPEGELTKV